MQKLIYFVLPFVFFACSGDNNQSDTDGTILEASVDSTDNRLSESEVAAGWMLLFDGTSTEQWRGYGKSTFPESGWAVESGHLVVKKSNGEEGGMAGDIVTRQEFRDFVFSFDFMLSDSANSGILYLVQEMTDTPIWHNAPEYQVLDDPTYTEMLGADWMPTHRTGENYDMHSNDDRDLKPNGQWNNGVIQKSGNHIQHWLNGKIVVEYDLLSPEWEDLVAKSKFKDFPQYGRAEQGYIGIQDHGHEVRYRNLKIRTR